jgi:RNA polymerase sigma factor (sigma-70 family)
MARALASATRFFTSVRSAPHGPRLDSANRRTEYYPVVDNSTDRSDDRCGGFVWLEPACQEAETAVAWDDQDNVRQNRPTLVETLYQRECKSLRRYIGRMLRNGCDAEDIVQEAFVRLWRALDTGKIQNPHAVLFRTARNLALNHIRNDRLRNSDSTRTALGDNFDRDDRSIEDELIASEEASACRLLMDILPPNCREAFTLRIVEELSYKETARAMRLSVSMIEKHIAKGKELCRARLAECEPTRNDRLAALRAF